MEPDYIGPGEVKAYEIIDYEFVKRQEQKRFPTERLSVKRFPLLMFDCAFNDRDAKLRRLVYQFISKSR